MYDFIGFYLILMTIILLKVYERQSTPAEKASIFFTRNFNA